LELFMFADFDWVALVRDLGLPACGLICLSWAIWKVVCWTGTNVVTPVRDRAFKLVDDLSATLTLQSTALDKIATSQGLLAQTQQQCLVNQEALRQMLEAHVISMTKGDSK
jgi:hypothetical protein